MKLFRLLIILFFVVLTDSLQPKKCFNNVAGFCRKKCRLGEISEMGCLHAKLCCVNEMENRRQWEAQHPPKQPVQKAPEVMDYIVLPTITYLTISL